MSDAEEMEIPAESRRLRGVRMIAWDHGAQRHEASCDVRGSLPSEPSDKALSAERRVRGSREVESPELAARVAGGELKDMSREVRRIPGNGQRRGQTDTDGCPKSSSRSAWLDDMGRRERGNSLESRRMMVTRCEISGIRRVCSFSARDLQCVMTRGPRGPVAGRGALA